MIKCRNCNKPPLDVDINLRFIFVEWTLDMFESCIWTCPFCGKRCIHQKRIPWKDPFAFAMARELSAKNGERAQKEQKARRDYVSAVASGEFVGCFADWLDAKNRRMADEQAERTRDARDAMTKKIMPTLLDDFKKTFII